MRRVRLVSLLLAAACGSDTTSEPRVTIKTFDTVNQAQLTSALTLFGGGGQWTVNLDVVVHNTTSEPRTFDVHPQCPSVIYAFNNAQGTGTPAWSTFSQTPNCAATTVLDTIAPGDSLVLHAPPTSTNEILANNGSPNPPGQYFFFFAVRTALATGGEVRQLAGFSLLSP
jgi:hypothetical protein